MKIVPQPTLNQLVLAEYSNNSGHVLDWIYFAERINLFQVKVRARGKRGHFHQEIGPIYPP